MQKSIQHLFIGILTILLISSCEKNEDEWTLAKTISLGDVSIRVPETYDNEVDNSERVEVSNGQGNSVAILKAATNGLSQDSIFNYRVLHYPVGYGTPTASDTTLLGHAAKKIVSTVYIAPQFGAEQTFISYIFIDEPNVYTLEFCWSKEFYSLSLNLMYDMLASLQIN